MDKNQTAVDWLESELDFLYQYMTEKNRSELFEQAKAKERIQIIYAYDDGANERHNDPVTGEQYYKETYEQ